MPCVVIAGCVCNVNQNIFLFLCSLQLLLLLQFSQFSLFTIIVFIIINCTIAQLSFLYSHLLLQFHFHIFTFVLQCSLSVFYLYSSFYLVSLVHPVHPLSAILSILSFQYLSLSRILVPRLPKHLVRELVENKIPAHLAHFVQIFVLNLRQKL